MSPKQVHSAALALAPSQPEVLPGWPDLNFTSTQNIPTHTVNQLYLGDVRMSASRDRGVTSGSNGWIIPEH